MDYKEHHRLNQEFLERFPLEKLKDMTIEQYTNLNRSDSFCYWLEIKTRILGSISGNSSFKFGIYQYNTRPNDDRARMSDGKYAWNSSYGKTAKKAFENVKKAVVKAAESGYAGDLDAIESIELAPMIKWKIAFMYSNESIIPYYSLDRLRVIGERMGMGNTQDASIADIQKFLIKERKGRDIHEYGRLLDDIWKESDSTTERTESSDKEDKTMQTTNIDKYIQLLETNKNLILTGAPGTGKTYLAKQIAKRVLNVESDEELQNDKRFGFVQFHPSYDYTDFVEGLRPTKENQSGDIGFKRQDGVFKAFCKQAAYDYQLFYKLYDGIAKDLLSGKINFDTERYKYIAKFTDDRYRITLNDINVKNGNEQKKGLNIEKIKIVLDYFVSHPEDWPSKVTKDGFNDIVAKSNIEGKYIEFYTKPIIPKIRNYHPIHD